MGPNPSRAGETHVLYRVQQQGRISVTVYDIAGREVKRLDSGLYAPGVRGVVWDGRDDAGNPVASGMYFVRFVGESGKTIMKRLTVMR